jgi:hypothetical protein
MTVCHKSALKHTFIFPFFLTDESIMKKKSYTQTDIAVHFLILQIWMITNRILRDLLHTMEK